MSGLESLAPQAKRVTVAGRDFDLLPVKMRDLKAFSDAAIPVAPLVLTNRVLEAATEHYEGMKAALAIAAKAEPEWLDGLDPEEFFRLVSAVVEVNGDFFVRRLTPLILVMQAQTQAAIDRLGVPSLPTSGATDTPSPPS